MKSDAHECAVLSWIVVEYKTNIVTFEVDKVARPGLTYMDATGTNFLRYKFGSIQTDNTFKGN